MQQKLQYDRSPIEMIANYIIKMREDPEYQKKYQEFLKEKEKEEAQHEH